jgi:acyl carrier protein
MEKCVKDKIVEIIHSIRPEVQFGADKDTDLFGVLDSLDIVFLVEEIEKQLDICIDADQIVPENFASLYTLEAFVRTKSK